MWNKNYFENFHNLIIKNINGIRSTLFNAHVKMATTETIVTQSEEDTTTPELVKENVTMEVLTDEDLEKTAQDFAEYLVVNNQQEVLYIYIYII